jgi:hypothetical protein
MTFPQAVSSIASSTSRRPPLSGSHEADLLDHPEQPAAAEPVPEESR